MLAKGSASDYLDVLAEFICRTPLEAIPDAVRQRGRVIIADCLPVIAAGMQCREMQAFAREQMSSHAPGRSSAFGTSARTSSLAAALINGAAGTWLELDEGNLYAKGHTGIQVVPAAIAHAQQAGGSGADLLLAVILGYEVAARICRSARMRPSVHPHGTYGVIGAAIAVASLERFTIPRMREVINVAATMGMATSRNTLHEGATVRNIYAGHAGLMGQMAVRLVAAGFTGEHDGVGSIYEGVLADSFDRSAAICDLGSDWLILKNYFKLYCTGRYVHSAIDALLAALEKVPGGWVDPDAIERIDVAAYQRAADLSGKNITTSFGARFSIPFALATILYHRHTGFEAFDEAAVMNPTVQALTQRVHISEVPSYTAEYPERQRCDIAIALRGGATLTGHCELTKGDARNPHRPEELTAKFFALGIPIWGRAISESLYDDLMHIERIRDLAGWRTDCDL